MKQLLLISILGLVACESTPITPLITEPEVVVSEPELMVVVPEPVVVTPEPEPTLTDPIAEFALGDKVTIDTGDGTTYEGVIIMVGPIDTWTNLDTGENRVSRAYFVEAIVDGEMARGMIPEFFLFER